MLFAVLCPRGPDGYKLNMTPIIIKGPQQIAAQHKVANIKVYFGVYVFVLITISFEPIKHMGHCFGCCACQAFIQSAWMGG